jgi:hypothetical protein
MGGWCVYFETKMWTPLQPPNSEPHLTLGTSPGPHLSHQRPRPPSPLPLPQPPTLREVPPRRGRRRPTRRRHTRRRTRPTTTTLILNVGRGEGDWQLRHHPPTPVPSRGGHPLDPAPVARRGWGGRQHSRRRRRGAHLRPPLPPAAPRTAVTQCAHNNTGQRDKDCRDNKHPESDWDGGKEPISLPSVGRGPPPPGGRGQDRECSQGDGAEDCNCRVCERGREAGLPGLRVVRHGRQGPLQGLRVGKEELGLHEHVCEAVTQGAAVAALEKKESAPPTPVGAHPGGDAADAHDPYQEGRRDDNDGGGAHCRGSGRYARKGASQGLNGLWASEGGEVIPPHTDADLKKGPGRRARRLGRGQS